MKLAGRDLEIEKGYCKVAVGIFSVWVCRPVAFFFLNERLYGPVEIEWKLRAAAFCRVHIMLQGPAFGMSAGMFGISPGRFVLHTNTIGFAELCGAQNRWTLE